MDKREKVLKGLEICKEDSKLCFGESECGYQSYFPRCWITLAADALALMKDQKPRVITMEEAAQADYCYVEYKSGDVEPVLVNSYGDGNYRLQRKDAYHVVGPDTFALYGRFWTSRPTNEQRMETPWKPQSTIHPAGATEGVR